MEDIKLVLELFDSVEKWNAYIELSNMRNGLIDELKDRLLSELQKEVSHRLNNSGWDYYFNKDHISIKPSETQLIGVTIEWAWWNTLSFPWGKRGAFIWVDANNTNSGRVFNRVKAHRDRLPMTDFVENYENHHWLPFAKQIPSIVFGDNNPSSAEECLFMAKDNANKLALNLWEEVFQPFANREVATQMLSFVQD